MSLGLTPGIFCFPPSTSRQRRTPNRGWPLLVALTWMSRRSYRGKLGSLVPGEGVTPMMTVPRFRNLLGSLLLILLMTPMPARAQYVYLDLNGDGVNTVADVLSGTLPVNVDV